MASRSRGILGWAGSDGWCSVPQADPDRLDEPADSAHLLAEPTTPPDCTVWAETPVDLAGVLGGQISLHEVIAQGHLNVTGDHAWLAKALAHANE